MKKSPCHTFLSPSTHQLPRIRLKPLKGFLCWHGWYDLPSALRWELQRNKYIVGCAALGLEVRTASRTTKAGEQQIKNNRGFVKKAVFWFLQKWRGGLASPLGPLGSFYNFNGTLAEFGWCYEYFFGLLPNITPPPKTSCAITNF